MLDCKEGLKHMFESHSISKCRLIVYALWAIWNSRNRFIHEEEVRSGSQVAEFVLNYLKELDYLKVSLLVERLHMARWDAPVGSRFKINFDAAYKKHRKESYSGLVVKNEKAEVICSKTVRNVNISSVFAAEVIACIQALDLGIHLGLKDVIVEGDFQTVIQKLQKEGDDRSEIAVYIKYSKYQSLKF
ncbi:hypothetical protein J1N35_014687 [Gossypium stocksii]|uniref:RNase H type-1 domain-containing protein n=1 Tax=Gossypium stocksii TaxID=47602 RepID=A0A9D3VWK7_9ROSI|nr:hypothetical protein J1N35_014687 [Gossypium stocksii]